jgi:hypothetical protein
MSGKPLSENPSSWPSVASAPHEVKFILVASYIRALEAVIAFALCRFFAVASFCLEHGEMGKASRTGYLTDVSDEEWAFVLLPYLMLSRPDHASREHNLGRSS